jgi:hypothetical protein
MPEKNKIWDAVNRHPSNAFAFFGRRAQLRDLVAILLNDLVAGHAESGRRDFGFVARGYAGVAVFARQVHLAGVNLVAEGNGLRRNGLRQHLSVFFGLSLLLRQSSIHEAESQ